MWALRFSFGVRLAGAEKGFLLGRFRWPFGIDWPVAGIFVVGEHLMVRAYCYVCY